MNIILRISYYYLIKKIFFEILVNIIYLNNKVWSNTIREKNLIYM